MNTGPGDAENPTGVFVPAHGGPVCAAVRWPRYWPEAETNRRPPAAGRPGAVSCLLRAGLLGPASWLTRRITPSAATPAPNAVAAENPGKVVGAGRDDDS